VALNEEQIPGERRTFHCAARNYLCPQSFFEWKAIKGQKAKQPYAIAMRWRTIRYCGYLGNWKDPTCGEWIRTFAIITTDANALVADIHDRMPVILSRYDYVRSLGEESDPRDLMRPFRLG
jgi:putative SOS response-associated peptidase YedK